MEDTLILVDSYDNEIGTAQKMEAHLSPMLHRAFSIFLYDDSGKEPMFLIQQRALHKYHSGGLWCNSCCSHPRHGEELFTAASRRLEEELGIPDFHDFTEVSSFVYLHKFNDHLFEYEFDHILLGRYNGDITVNPDEAMDTKWISASALANELRTNPEIYSSWFLTAAPLVLNFIKAL